MVDWTAVTILSVTIILNIICNLIAIIFIRCKTNIKKKKYTVKEKVVLLLCVINLCQIAGYGIELHAALYERIEDIACQTQGFIACFCTYTNVGLFVSFTIERYISITFSSTSLYYRKFKSLLFLLVPVLIGVLLGTPPLIGWGSYERSQDITYCSYRFKSFNDRSFFIMGVLGGFVLPSTVASICFARMIKELRRTTTTYIRRYGKKSVISLQSRRHKEDHAAHFLVIGMIYCASWLPYASVCFLFFANQNVPLSLEYFAISMCKSSTVSSAILFCLIERPFCRHVKRKESVNMLKLRRTLLLRRSMAMGFNDQKVPFIGLHEQTMPITGLHEQKLPFHEHLTPIMDFHEQKMPIIVKEMGILNGYAVHKNSMWSKETNHDQL